MESKTTVLSFKYGTSKGHNTYGYNIVTLYANGKKVVRTCGGGYNMRGTCLGKYIEQNYIERLKVLKSNRGSEDKNEGFYGLTFTRSGITGRAEYTHTYDHNARMANVHLDGTCGEQCMVRIADAIGVHLESIQLAPNEWGYILTDDNK